MELIQTVEEMQARSDRLRCGNRRIGLVPTMGFLHEGHLSLVKEGQARSDDLVVSIFVNPTQFGPTEDLATYPRDLDRDLELLEAEGTDAVFAPSAAELYPSKYQTFVSLRDLPNHLCGLSRPVHFEGVATIVTKLFHIVKPHVAVFGRKDYQQLIIIRQMVRDLNFAVEIVGVPIVREPDGLAMSSRNTYLTPRQRPSALTLQESLTHAQRMVADGERQAKVIIQASRDYITSRPETHIDYVTICDPETLEDIDTIDRPALMALAVVVGRTRLIDNRILVPQPR